MKAIFLSPQGIIKGNPEFPEKTKSYCPGRGFCSCDDPPAKACEVLEYERAYQHAIDTALDLEDQELASKLIIQSPLFKGKEFLKPYPVEGFMWEVVANLKDCSNCGATVREQRKGCNEVTCYKGRPDYNRTVYRLNPIDTHL